MSLHVFHSGNWVQTDDLYFRQGTGIAATWREVVALYTYAQNPPDSGLFAWLPVFDNFQEPPRKVHGTSPGHSSGRLVWEAPPRAVDYRVVMRAASTPTQPARTTYFPADENDPWLTATYWDLSGLEQDRSYDLTVIARRQSPSDGTYLKSSESAKATLSTGHQPTVVQNPEYPGTQIVYIAAAKSDTWSKDNSWGQTTGDVVQGYASTAARNGYGAVSYASTYSQLAKLPGGNPTADHIEVMDAWVDRIYRKSGGSGTPTVEAYAWRGPFSGNPGLTDIASSKGTFTAPAEGAYKDDFIIVGPVPPVTVPATPRENKLLTWAKEWAKRAPAHIGMLIYRTGGSGNTTAGYNGYAVMRAANTTVREWRLKLAVRWQYNSPELLAPTWTPGA
jgi:hypothetical protein